jgi:hypothetical protein
MEGYEITLFVDKSKVEALNCAICLGVVRDVVETPWYDFHNGSLLNLRFFQFVVAICFAKSVSTLPLYTSENALSIITHWNDLSSGLLNSCGEPFSTMMSLVRTLTTSKANALGLGHCVVSRPTSVRLRESRNPRTRCLAAPSERRNVNGASMACSSAIWMLTSRTATLGECNAPIASHKSSVPS